MYNIDFQLEVLHLLTTNIKFAINYGILLKPDYFDSQQHRILFGIISDHVIGYEKELEQKDLLMLIQDFVSSRGYDNEIFKTLKKESDLIFKTYIKSEPFIIDQLVKFSRKQEMKNAVLKSIDILEKEGSYEEILKLIDGAVSIGSGVNEGKNFSDLTEFPSIYKNRYNPDNLIRTGFHKFDNSLMGGVASGEVHIIQAPPKSGKSTIACNIGAFALMTNKSVFHITLEISDIDVLAKYACRLTGMKYKELLSCKLDEYKEKIKRFKKYSPSLFVNHWPEGTANTLNIRSWISRIRSKENISPDLILLDYDDCLVPVIGSTGSMYDDAGEIYKDLIQLADYFNCSIITFAQPKREAWNLPNEGELISAHHIAHSAKKIHKCFSVSSLNFKDNSNNGTLYIDLVRRGTGNVKIKISRDLDRALFKEESYN